MRRLEALPRCLGALGPSHEGEAAEQTRDPHGILSRGSISSIHVGGSALACGVLGRQENREVSMPDRIPVSLWPAVLSMLSA